MTSLHFSEHGSQNSCALVFNQWIPVLSLASRYRVEQSIPYIKGWKDEEQQQKEGSMSALSRYATSAFLTTNEWQKQTQINKHKYYTVYTNTDRQTDGWMNGQTDGLRTGVRSVDQFQPPTSRRKINQLQTTYTTFALSFIHPSFMELSM